MYSDLTITSRSWLKRFSHLARFEMALSELGVRYVRVLDFGAGDGYFAIRALHKLDHIDVYEPDAYMIEQLHKNASLTIAEGRLSLYTAYKDLTGHSYDAIFCMEVLEHLSENALMEVIGQMKALLAPGGVVYVTVPIEEGLSGFLKHCLRSVMRQRHGGATWKGAFRSALYLNVARTPSKKNPSYIPSHVGFSHRKLKVQLLHAGMELIRSRYSPFPWLGGVMNSQVMFVLRAGRSEPCPKVRADSLGSLGERSDGSEACVR